MQNDILILIQQNRSVDEYGDAVITETQREVFCDVLSIGYKEFYQANAVGFSPEVKFKLADYLDYESEQFAIYNGERYRIIRNYRTGLGLELICSKEVNDGHS